MAQIHIPTLAPEVLTTVGPFTITNTLVNAWIALVIFVVVGIFVSRNVKLRPGKIQTYAEFFLDTLMGYFDQVTGGRKNTLRFLPIVGSVFFFILLSNWLGLLPGTGSLLVGHNPALRPANTDLNLTVAMAVVAVISSHVFGILSIGFFSHLNKFLPFGTIVKSLKKGPIAIFTALVEFMIGILEVIAEFAKMMSLSLRLFGNIFAGEVLISVITGLMAALVPTPFMLLEVLVGLIQASVFAMLTLVYCTVASMAPHGGEH